MTIVTAFRSRLRLGVDDAYQEAADDMSRIAQSRDGFVDQRFYTSPEGERVTQSALVGREF
jgi:hypothetical protein